MKYLPKYYVQLPTVNFEMVKHIYLLHAGIHSRQALVLKHFW